MVKETAKMKKEKEHEVMQSKVDDTNWLLENAPIINWKEIAKKYKMTDEALVTCSKYVDWARLCQNQPINPELIKKFKKKMGPHNIVNRQKLTPDLLEDVVTIFGDNQWYYLNDFELPIDFINKYYMKLNLDKIPTKHLNEKEMEEFNACVIMRKLIGKVN